MMPHPREINEVHKPYFLITIDTEGDDLWSRPRTITTRNAEYLPRFQALCEVYGLKPTYLTNYEMANSPCFQEFGRGILQKNTGEIGMHLHAWDSPPLKPLTADDHKHHPYLMEYARDLMREKIAVMTGLLEETFGAKMVSHRAGRWGMNETYAQLLVEHGYRIDCSVTPNLSWRQHAGAPTGNGGADYSQFPDEPYFVDLLDMGRPGDSPLLELPMTIFEKRVPLIFFLNRVFKNTSVIRERLNYYRPTYFMFRPTGKNLNRLLNEVEAAVATKKHYIEFMLHSSEVMPGGSPNFPDEDSIEQLYHDLEILFRVAAEKCTGATLKEYHDSYTASN